jgi:hypothetical protein
VGEGSISSLNRSARASRQILIIINSIIYNHILRIDSKKNTGLRKLKCGMWDTRIIGEILGGTHCNLWLLEHPDEEMLIVERSIISSILSAMAGHIAQEMGAPGSVEPGQMESDRELLAEILFRCNPESGWNEAEEAVSRELKDNWYLVDGLAKVLIERKTITGKEARIVLGELKEAYLACIPQLGI